MWDDSGARSQMQELEDMMGEGPLFEGIEPAEIQQGCTYFQQIIPV